MRRTIHEGNQLLIKKPKQSAGFQRYADFIVFMLLRLSSQSDFQ